MWTMQNRQAMLTDWGRNKIPAILHTYSMKMFEIWLKLSLKFVSEVWFNNIPALVQIMAWCRPHYKPSSEPMMVSLLTHICIIWHHWVNKLMHWGMKKVWHSAENIFECIFLCEISLHFIPTGPTDVNQHWFRLCHNLNQCKLEQLECLHSEIPPLPHDYPY